MKTEDKNTGPAPEKGINWLGVLIAFGYPLMPAVILFGIFEILYLGTGSLFCLIMAILTVVGYLGFAFSFLLKNKRVKKA